MSKVLRAIDLFCGAGGTTTGAEMSSRVKVAIAVNHWSTAISTHRLNHPHVRHLCAPIDLVDPRDFAGEGIDVVMASPECIFHSNARGGKPVDDQRRATAWCVPRWAEVLRPKWIVVENVREFEDWAPLGSDNKPLKSKKGEIFTAWVNSLRALNYHVEWKLLNAAEFGGATKRIRLFIVCRRGPSTKPIPWPAVTHTKEQWAPASSIIDWSLPCPSIFNRKRPLADKTLKRIEVGLRRFCGAIAEPLPTADTQNRHAVAMPFMVDVHHGSGKSRSSSIDQPIPTLVTKPGNSLVLPFLTEFYGNGGSRSINDPVSTITCKHRHGLVTAELMQTMTELGIVDVGFRMLEPHELAAAQGFPKDYQIYGNKADQVKQIGNSVHTLVSKAICQAIGDAA